MNTRRPDASTRFTSLDDTFRFDGQTPRLNVAVLSHTADGPHEMDLQVGDKIEVKTNNWNGYSTGRNLRTNETKLYPTYKVRT